MIPDKIYLGVGPMSGDEPNKRYIYAEWNENPMPRVQNIAYIRKSALLEWARERLKLSDAKLGIHIGFSAAELIEYLDSL